jgi:hypothetical protein
VLLVAVVLGLGVQPWRPLPGTDAAGTLAYAAAAVGVAALLLPERGAWLPGVAGTAVACAVELAQLTPVPALVIDRAPVLALLLGRTFSVVDLVVLLAGGVLGTAALAVPGRRRGTTTEPMAGKS